MKLFTKLALVSAVAVSGSAMAMESMDDSALSSTTGQDGISLGIALDHISIQNLYIHDNGGLALTGTAAIPGNDGPDGIANTADDVAATPATSNYNGVGSTGATGTTGAITITGTGYAGTLATGATQQEQDAHALKLRTQTNGIDIKANPGASNANIVKFGTQNVLAKLDIDSDAGTGTNGAFLNIAAKVSGLDIAIGKIGVAKSNAAQASGAQRGIVTGSNNTIIDGLNLKTGMTTANIQLGATPQGAMINLSGTMTGGLEIADLGIVDNAGGGTIRIGSIVVSDTGVADLTTNAKVSVVPGALKIEAMSNATDMYIKSIKLGESALTPASALGSIGDVEVRNMQVSHGGIAGAVILVTGH